MQVVELPYEGGDLAMDILLPEDAHGLAALEAKMVAGQYAAWHPDSDPYRVGDCSAGSLCREVGRLSRLNGSHEVDDDLGNHSAV